MLYTLYVLVNIVFQKNYDTKKYKVPFTVRKLIIYNISIYLLILIVLYIVSCLKLIYNYIFACR